VTLPDLPFLSWRFVRDNGEVVERNNPVDFMKAVHAAFNVVRRYIAGDVALPDADLPAADAALIENMLRTTLAIEGEDRHPVWLKAIAEGKFSFGAETVTYVDHGPGSWKMQALGRNRCGVRLPGEFPELGLEVLPRRGALPSPVRHPRTAAQVRAVRGLIRPWHCPLHGKGSTQAGG